MFLAIVIMLTKLTFLRKFFTSHISRNSTVLHSIVKTYIVFQSSRTILLLYAADISVFTNSLCIFEVVNIIFLNFSTSKVQKSFYNILLKRRKILFFTHFLNTCYVAIQCIFHSFVYTVNFIFLTIVLYFL